MKSRPGPGRLGGRRGRGAHVGRLRAEVLSRGSWETAAGRWGRDGRGTRGRKGGRALSEVRACQVDPLEKEMTGAAFQKEGTDLRARDGPEGLWVGS